MPAVVVVTNKVAMDQAGANQPWPTDVKLYQPLEKEQILMDQSANCLGIQALLRICKLKYEIMEKSNAEAMSPSGHVPLIKCGQFLISDWDPLITFLANKGINLTSELDAEQKLNVRPYMSLIRTVLTNAENYISWIDQETYREVTRKRYSSVHPWPLNVVLVTRKKTKMIDYLDAMHWSEKTMDQVFDEVVTCCEAFSAKLEGKKFFFGDKPTEVDAMLFGHIFTILTTPLPSNRLAATIREYPLLVEHCQTMEKEFFSDTAAAQI